MTPAQKLGHLRLVAIGLSLAAVFVVPMAASRLRPGAPAVAVGVGVVTLAASAVTFFFFVFRWRPRCPRCNVARARFVRSQDEDEYLVCSACGFREPTGYTFRD